MNLKEAAGLLGWKRELVELAISEGVETPRKKIRVKLFATPQGSDFDILDEEVDKFLALFEAEEPGRNPPVAVRRELLVECGYQCAVCRSDAPLRFHHIIDWANLKHHDTKHMLAICGSCHDKIGLGQIDTKAQREFKVKVTSPLAIASPQANSTPIRADQVIDASDAERVVWCLPRGFLMMEDVTFEDNASWAVVIHYYHFVEGWRTGTHFHKSYREWWRTNDDLNKQCYKVDMPMGDRDFAYGAFYLMQRIRDTEKPLDIRKLVESQSKRDYVKYYQPSQPVLLSEVEGKFPEWASTHALRDLVAEMDDFISTDYGQGITTNASDEAFSIAHRTVVEAIKHFGANHPTLSFAQRIADEYESGWSESQSKDWVKRLKRVVVDAIRTR